MAGNPEYQNLGPVPTPPTVTPSVGAAVPALYDAVTPHGRGTAPYDVQAPQEDLAGLAAAAVGLAGPGGPRQAAAQSLLSSPQGYGEQDVDAGWSGGAGGWPANVEPAGM